MSQKNSDQSPSNDSHHEGTAIHWADHAAEALVAQHPGKSQFVVASGISPSGMVHIGNFREVITVDLVVRALKSRGKSVRFIYSWDDYDALRKVPANLPNPEMIKANLRKPLAQIPDPYEQDASYAAHFERLFEESLAPLEVEPEYLRQNECYRRGDYAEGIKRALENEPKIAEILNRFRTEPLPKDWTCLSIFCQKCGRDTTELRRYEPPYRIHYRCEGCKEDLTTDFSQKESGVKLLWRVDWPMRWAKEGVDFEPGGKDHSSTGGSFETGKHIVREVWQKEPPFYVQYDFVMIKGAGAKLSSSSGQLITLGEALEVYEPAVLRWIFASRKPNIDFSIAFDLDVLKAYDDFDRTARIALAEEPVEEKKYLYEKRIYELSRTEDYPLPSTTGEVVPLSQFSFRHLCNILQIHDGNLDKAMAHYQKSMTTKADEKRFLLRAKRAWTWITQFSPPEFRFRIKGPEDEISKTTFPEAMGDLIKILSHPGVGESREEDLHNQIYNVIKSRAIEPKAFFQEIYFILVGKAQGPKLASFLLAMGPERALSLIKKSL